MAGIPPVHHQHPLLNWSWASQCFPSLHWAVPYNDPSKTKESDCHLQHSIRTCVMRCRWFDGCWVFRWKRKTQQNPKSCSKRHIPWNSNFMSPKVLVVLLLPSHTNPFIRQRPSTRNNALPEFPGPLSFVEDQVENRTVTFAIYEDSEIRGGNLLCPAEQVVEWDCNLQKASCGDLFPNTNNTCNTTGEELETQQGRSQEEDKHPWPT